MYDLVFDAAEAEREREARKITAASGARRALGGVRGRLITRVRRAIGGCADAAPVRPSRPLSTRGEE
jgi:hypothetical protein